MALEGSRPSPAVGTAAGARAFSSWRRELAVCGPASHPAARPGMRKVPEIEKGGGSRQFEIGAGRALLPPL